MKEIKKQARSDKHYFWYSKRQSSSDLLNQTLQKGFNTHDPLLQTPGMATHEHELLQLQTALIHCPRQ